MYSVMEELGINENKFSTRIPELNDSVMRRSVCTVVPIGGYEEVSVKCFLSGYYWVSVYCVLVTLKVSV